MSPLSFLLNLCASDNVQCAAKTLAFQRESQQMRCPQGVSLSMTGRFYLRKLSRPSRFRLQRQHSPFPKRSLGERQAEYKKKQKKTTSGLFLKKTICPSFQVPAAFITPGTISSLMSTPFCLLSLCTKEKLPSSPQCSRAHFPVLVTTEVPADGICAPQ